MCPTARSNLFAALVGDSTANAAFPALNILCGLTDFAHAQPCRLAGAALHKRMSARQQPCDAEKSSPKGHRVTPAAS